MNVAAGDRIAGHTAAEMAHFAGGVAAALTEKVDVGDDFAALIGAHGAHVRDQPGVADDHLDLAADLTGHRDRRIGMRLKLPQVLRVHADRRARARDFEHLADRREHLALRSRGGWGLTVLGKTVHFVEKLTQGRLSVSILRYLTGIRV